MVDSIVNGQAVEGMEEYSLAELTNDALQANVKALFLPVEQVNKDNVSCAMRRQRLPGI